MRNLLDITYIIHTIYTYMHTVLVLTCNMHISAHICVLLLYYLCYTFFAHMCIVCWVLMTPSNKQRTVTKSFQISPLHIYTWEHLLCFSLGWVGTKCVLVFYPVMNNIKHHVTKIQNPESIITFCIVPYCNVLYCSVLYCIVLYCIILYYIL